MTPRSNTQSSAASGNPPNPFVVLQQDANLIRMVDEALADATRRAGSHLACRPGCTQCCYGAFAISPLDALRLRAAMAEMASSDPNQAAILAGRANRYLEEFGPSFPGDRQTGILGTSEQDQASFEDFANNAPCPALDPATGLCDLYAARPMTCRVFGPPVRSRDTQDEEGLAVCELCFTDASPDEIAAAEMTVPYAEEQSLLNDLRAMHPQAGDTIIAYCLTLPSSAPVQPS